jgi:ribosomal protein S18 acetylase RimI-like enzyme
MKMISYTQSVEGLTSDRLHGFFAGWPKPPSPQTHLVLLQNSAYVVLAVDEETGNVVGFVTAISDEILTAHIPLLEVLPAYQGRGIGGELMRRVLDELSGLYAIDLLCDPDLQAFYERLGMRRAVGMMVRNYERQSGAS